MCCDGCCADDDLCHEGAHGHAQGDEKCEFHPTYNNLHWVFVCLLMCTNLSTTSPSSSPDVSQDVNEMKKVSAELKNQAAENQRMMVELNYSVKDNRKDITELFSNVAGVRTELEGIQTKLLEIDELRTLIKDQRTNFEDLSTNYQQFKVKTNQNHSQVVDDVKGIEKQSNDTAFETKELRHIVDHFGDNLILSSNQITVESTAGFSKRPMSLFDVMKYCQRDLEDLNATGKDHEARISVNTEAITTKADATVAFAVQTLDKDVLAIKNHLKQEEDQGISVSLVILSTLRTFLFILLSLLISFCLELPCYVQFSNYNLSYIVREY
jgi:hypothetical protein